MAEIMWFVNFKHTTGLNQNMFLMLEKKGEKLELYVIFRNTNKTRQMTMNNYLILYRYSYFGRQYRKMTILY